MFSNNGLSSTLLSIFLENIHGASQKCSEDSMCTFETLVLYLNYACLIITLGTRKAEVLFTWSEMECLYTHQHSKKLYTTVMIV